MNKESIVQKIRQVEKKYGLPENLLVGIAQTESQFKPEVITGKERSSTGALGLMQFMPNTAKQYNVKPLDIDSAIDGAARYMKVQIKNAPNNDLQLAVLAYNQGMGNVNKFVRASRTPEGLKRWADARPDGRDYVTKVFNNANANGGDYDANSAASRFMATNKATKGKYIAATGKIPDIANTENNDIIKNENTKQAKSLAPVKYEPVTIAETAPQPLSPIDKVSSTLLTPKETAQYNNEIKKEAEKQLEYNKQASLLMPMNLENTEKSTIIGKKDVSYLLPSQLKSKTGSQVDSIQTFDAPTSIEYQAIDTAELPWYINNQLDGIVKGLS